jgi:hypothetical protein
VLADLAGQSVVPAEKMDAVVDRRAVVPGKGVALAESVELVDWQRAAKAPDNAGHFHKKTYFLSFREHF